MTKQFDLLSDSPIARASDPATSHMAGHAVTESGARASQQRIALAGVYAFPGMTSNELAVVLKVDRYQIARRLPELRASKLVCNGPARRCKISGQRALTWFCVDGH